MNPWLSSAPPAPPPVTGDEPMAAAAAENSSGKKIFHNILLMSYKYNDNNNLMLAAVISLLLVILVVIALHVYARCFFSSPSRRHHVAADHVVIFGLSALPGNNRKGLGRSDIARNIPPFVYQEDGAEEEDDGCVICLSGFEDGDVGRQLPKCSHAFHADCIDMWLFSHASCPICRAPVVVSGGEPENDGGGAADSAVVPP